MRTRQTKVITLVLTASTLLVGCGGGSICDRSRSEVHLTQSVTEPSTFSMVLQHVDQTCTTVGRNQLHAYYIAGDGSPRAALPRLLDANTGGVEIQSVSTLIPSQGLGSSEDPYIDSDDPSLFNIYFQVPGAWLLTLDLTVPEVGSDLETVVFDIDVVE